MVVQNISSDGKKTDLTFTIKSYDLNKTKKIINKNNILVWKNDFWQTCLKSINYRCWHGYYLELHLECFKPLLKKLIFKLFLPQK